MNPCRTLLLGAIFASASFTPRLHAHEPAQDATAFGRPGAAKDVARTFTITLSDSMRFIPAALSVRRGETVRLHLVNTGKLPHEFVLGTQAEIDEHAEMMRRMPAMVHADASSVRVAPGHAADIVWQFTKPGVFPYACLIPGHREAGMQGRVSVSATATAAPAKR